MSRGGRAGPRAGGVREQGAPQAQTPGCRAPPAPDRARESGQPDRLTASLPEFLAASSPFCCAAWTRPRSWPHRDGQGRAPPRGGDQSAGRPKRRSGGCIRRELEQGLRHQFVAGGVGDRASAVPVNALLPSRPHMAVRPVHRSDHGRAPQPAPHTLHRATVVHPLRRRGRISWLLLPKLAGVQRRLAGTRVRSRDRRRGTVSPPATPSHPCLVCLWSFTCPHQHCEGDCRY